LLVLCWSFTHRYQGLDGDARLYAFQAMARLHPALVNDLYLRNTSQDAYTVFSGFYAKCIEMIGLGKAALILTLVFKIWFFAAAWLLARRLSNSCGAFITVALLIITAGGYGAFGVFRYAEDWLTARSPAEALVLTALACWAGGWRLCGLLIACIAIFVHPLMALPGLLLLIYLELPLQLGAAFAATGILLVLGAAEFASSAPFAAPRLLIMDAAWLEVVRERSQFLFLQLWRPEDWALNARPFLSLSLSVLAISDPRSRKIGASAMIIGGAGLAVALIASRIGPITLLLQGQAWRWVWVSDVVSIALLVLTIRAMWRSQPCGLPCSLLMICGRLLPTIPGAACLACALILWALRDRINAAGARVASSVSALAALTIIARGRAFAYWTRFTRFPILLSLLISALIAVSAYFLRHALQEASTDRTASTVDFSDWRRAIPPSANVWVESAHNSAAFAWFTLERPSYLTVDQSSGVVFSRVTALEVRRRSQALQSVMDPDWKLLSSLSSAYSGGGSPVPVSRPLTRDRLVSVCADPQLGFVVAAENLGFEALQQTDPGNRRYLYLYDCGHVRSLNPPLE
jgi:hypothetical protein